MRRRIYLAAALALAMAACGGSETEETTTSRPAVSTTSTTVAPPPTTTTSAAPETTSTSGPGFEAGELGAVEVGPREAIESRSLNAISGEVAFLGIPNDLAIRLAVEDYGEIKGHDVNVGTGLDDLCSADGGQSAAQTIVSDESVIGVIGTSCSGAAAAASPLISAAGLVMISPSNTSPSLTSDLEGNSGENWNLGYYRTAHNDLFQGQAAAKSLEARS